MCGTLAHFSHSWDRQRAEYRNDVPVRQDRLDGMLAPFNDVCVALSGHYMYYLFSYEHHGAPLHDMQPLLPIFFSGGTAFYAQHGSLGNVHDAAARSFYLAHYRGAVPDRSTRLPTCMRTTLDYWCYFRLFYLYYVYSIISAAHAQSEELEETRRLSL